MKNRFVLCFILIFYSISVLSQSVRYKDNIFENVDVLNDVIYGNQPELLSPFLDESDTENVDLLMDIHFPNGDTETNRPVIIFIHGGAFVSGNKSHDDMKALCDTFALKGYVTATISYRLGMNTTSSESATRAVVRGLQDGRAAVRFLRANSETYGIDPNRVYMAGSSAGGFISLHSLFMNEESEMPSEAGTYSYTYPIATPPFVVNVTAPDLGGYDIGDNLTENSIPDAILSLWGAVKNTNLITEADLKPIFLVHGTSDNIVPFGAGSPFSLPTFPATYGSENVNNAIDVIGFEDKFTYFVEGQGHEFYGVTNGNWDPAPNAYWDTIVNLAIDFFYSVQLQPDENGIIYVSQDAAGNGSSWENATGNLQDAIDAYGVSEVWVKNGVYYPTKLIDSESTDTRMKSIVMKDGVNVYGGFVGSEISIDERVLDIENLQTEITSFSDNNSEKSYHIVVFDTVGMSVETIIDGFKITNGNADNMVDAAHHFGGGIVVSPNSIVVNCDISDNNAEIGGGVVYYEGGLIESSKICNNTASLHGGGIAILYNGILKNSEISSNIAVSRGAGIYAEGNAALIENCFVIGNTSEDYGAGIYFRDVENAVTSGCYYNNNSATTSGGAIYAYNSNLQVLSSTITQNEAISGYGGGLNTFEASSVIIENSVFIDNTANTGNNIYECSTDCSVDVSYSGVEGGYIGEGNVDISSADFVDDYRIYDGVDEVFPPSKCLNSGNTISVDSENLDIDDNPRVSHGIVDIGAFESTTCKSYSLTSENTTGHALISPIDTLVYYKNNLTFMIYPEENWGLFTAEYNSESVVADIPWGDGFYNYDIEKVVEDGNLVISMQYISDIVDLEQKNISIYPNPANDKFYISNAKGYNVKIYNSEGKLIEENVIKDDNYSLNTSDYSKGLYFINLSNDKETVVRRVSIN